VQVCDIEGGSRSQDGGRFTEGQLRANDLDVLVDAVVAAKVPRRVMLDVNRHSMTDEIVTVNLGYRQTVSRD
jgi:hypothetical protein